MWKKKKEKEEEGLGAGRGGREVEEGYKHKEDGTQ